MLDGHVAPGASNTVCSIKDTVVSGATSPTTPFSRCRPVASIVTYQQEAVSPYGAPLQGSGEALPGRHQIVTRWMHGGSRKAWQCIETQSHLLLRSGRSYMHTKIIKKWHTTYILYAHYVRTTVQPLSHKLGCRTGAVLKHQCSSNVALPTADIVVSAPRLKLI